MRSQYMLAMFVGALLTASVALAGGVTTPAPAKQPAAATTSAAPSAAVQKDMQLSKDQIIAMQHALTKSGVYKGKADGTLGKETRTALREYQKKNHLPVSGKADEQTLEKLGVQVASTTMGHAPNGPSGMTPTPH